MNDQLFIPVLLGTVRKRRRSEGVARWMLDVLHNQTGVETRLIDPRELDLPMDDEGRALGEKNEQYRETILRSDGVVIVTPEYNHAYPGTLKRTIDVLFPEYAKRAAGLVGVSNGMFGGARAVEQLRLLVSKVGMMPVSKALYVPNVEETFKSNAPVDAQAYEERANVFVQDVIWLARVLKWGREQLGE